MKTLRLLCLFILSALCVSTPALAAPIPDVVTALKEWKETVEAGKVDDIMHLYDRNAIMISTFAQAPLTKREQIENYYKKVVANTGIKVVVEDAHPRTYSNIATISGRYTLSYLQEGEPIVIPARFTFVYQLEGGKWMIVEQHSSRVPLPEEDK